MSPLRRRHGLHQPGAFAKCCHWAAAESGPGAVAVKSFRFCVSFAVRVNTSSDISRIYFLSAEQREGSGHCRTGSLGAQASATPGFRDSALTGGPESSVSLSIHSIACRGNKAPLFLLTHDILIDEQRSLMASQFSLARESGQWRSPQALRARDAVLGAGAPMAVALSTPPVLSHPLLLEGAPWPLSHGS